MRRLLVLAVVLISASLLVNAPASAKVKDVDASTLAASGTISLRNAGSSGTGGRNQSTGGGPPPPPAMHWNSSGFACVTGRGSFIFTINGIGGLVPRCSGGGSQPPRPTPAEAAYQAWHFETKLPSPSLATSPPSGAITGLDLYLAIGGAQTLGFNIAALGYDIRLDVTSTYDIDWGDPRPDGTRLGAAVTKDHRTQGGLYPNGDLRHQYIERGTVTITVTQRWTARWSGGGESGTIADRLSTSATRTIPVEEIVAVAKPVGSNPFAP